MRISACVYTHAFFYAWQRIKYGHGMRIFQAFIKKFFLRCDVTRLLSVVVMVLAFETFNVDSVLTKIKTFFFYAKVIENFCNHFWDFLFGNFYKVYTTRPKVLD